MLAADPQILDSRDLDIRSAADAVTKQRLEFTVGDAADFMGSKVEVKLPSSEGKT